MEELVNSLSMGLGEIENVLNNAFGAVVEELSGIRNEIVNLRRN